MPFSFSELSIDDFVGTWDYHLRNYDEGGTVICTKVSVLEVRCLLSRYGYKLIYFEGSKLYYASDLITTLPTLSIDEQRKRLLDWNNGNIWIENGICNNLLLLFLIIVELWNNINLFVYVYS